MSYQLGVDLGTTFTAAAIANGQAPALVALGQRAAQIPSVLYLAPDGFLVGEAAERSGSVDPGRVAREFKRRLGDPVPILVGGSPFSAEALTAQLLHWVVGQAARQRGQPPTGLVLTHPANWGEFKLEVLRQAVVLADVGPAVWCPEPVAAAAQYATRSRVATGAKLAVYDLGGGTFDACVVEKTAYGFAILGSPEGVEHLGGADLDEALFQRVLGSLGSALDRADPDDPATVVGLARLRRDCVEAKEALSSDADVSVPVSLPGLVTTIRVSRSEFEALIRPALGATVSALHRAVRSAGVGVSELDGIVLVGGSSRIPLVGELLQREFQLAPAVDTHPKHDVVLGAMELTRQEHEPRGTKASPAVVPSPSPTLEQPAPGAPVGGPQDAEASISRNPSVPARESVLRPVSGQDLVPPAPLRRSAGDDRVGKPAGKTISTRSAGGATTRNLGRPLLAALAVVVAGVLVGTAVHFSGTSASTGPSLAAGPAAPASSTSPGPAGPVLPRSAPLAPTQLIVPMRVDGNWDLYLGDTREDAPIRQLTTDPAAEYGQALSPDGATVIFMRDPNPDDDRRTLWVAGAATGKDARPLFDPTPAPCSGLMYRPAWSPVDPTLLAVPCTNTQGHWGLYLIRTDGTVVREIRVPGDTVDDPAFAPDGKSLAFWSGPASELDGGHLYVQSLDGRDPPRQLTKSAIAGRDADPTWAKDGRSIVFRRRVVEATDGANNDINRIAADGASEPVPLADSSADAQDPSFSPDGQQIAYTANAPAKQWPGKAVLRVWVMDSDGTNRRLLWTKGAAAQQAAPAWSRR